MRLRRVAARIIALPGRAASAARRGIVRVGAPFLPEPGTTEGAVTVGLILVGVGLYVAGFPGPALFIPGGTLVAIGLGFTFRRG